MIQFHRDRALLRLTGVSRLWPVLLLGCTEPATQLIVSVGTDYREDELTWVEAHTERLPGGERSDVHSYDRSIVGMPFSFGVAPQEGDEDLEIMVIVQGFRERGDNVLVEKRARTGFIEKKTLNLPMFLEKRCGRVWDDCATDQTCENGECVSAEQPPEQLSPYDPKLDPNVVPPVPGDEDAGTPDGGEDGGTPDGGFDAGYDAGFDAGTPDDGGVLPVNCQVALGAPELIATANIAFDPNLDLLAADLDNDGVIELVAGRSEASASPFAVIDFGDCDAPVVTATAAHGELRQGLLYSDYLLAVERRKISRWDYLGPNMIQESDSTVAVASDIERLALSIQGEGLAVANIGGWQYVGFDSVTGFAGMTAAPRRPVGFSAESQGRFFHGDDQGLRAITPGAPAADVALGSDTFDPVITQSFDGTRLIAARTAGQQLAIARWNGAVQSTASVDFGVPIIAGPIQASDDDDSFVYVLLQDGTLTGCRSQDGSPCEILSNTRQFPLDEVDGQRTLLAAYVDQDSRPDIVFVSRRGKVFFADGANLSNDAAPMIDLALDARGGAAIAGNFFSAFTLQGSLLAVPHDGRLSLIGWRTLGFGSSSSLWLQHRRDARRSAREP